MSISTHNIQKSADAVDFGAPFGVQAGAFGPGATYSFTFNKVGEFHYTCTIHTLMNGSVRVVAAGATTTTG
jgi:plastocyanin